MTGECCLGQHTAAMEDQLDAPKAQVDLTGNQEASSGPVCLHEQQRYQELAREGVTSWTVVSSSDEV